MSEALTALTLTMPDHANRGHADLGASSIKRWRNCKGSVRMLKGRKRVSSAAADKGTSVHELGEICFKSGQETVEYIDRKVGGNVIDEDMAAGGQVYVKALKGLQEQYPNGQLFIEQKVSLAPLKPPGEMYGTTDGLMIAPPYVHGLDYKNGTQTVEADTDQIRYYNLAAWVGLPKEIRDQITTFRQTIVQPNAFHPDGPIRTVEYSLADLKMWAKGMLTDAKLAMAPDAPLNAGSWCKESFCDARGDCPAYAQLALQVASEQFDDVPEEVEVTAVIENPKLPLPITLTPEQIGLILERAEVFTDWIGQVKNHAFHCLNRGEPIPGWKLVSMRAMRQWNRESEAIEALKTVHGLTEDDIYVKKPISPAVAEKKIGKKKFAAIEQCYVVKVSSGAKLAPESDKAPAIVGVSIESQFDEIAEG